MELTVAAAVGLVGSTTVLAKLSRIGTQPVPEAAMHEALQKLNLSRLLRRLAHEDGLGTIERAKGAIREYKLFLRLVWLHPGESLLPSAAVDAVWQRHLLDTKAYHEDCLGLFGRHLHRIYGAQQPDEALVRTRVLYQTAYAKPSSSEFWGGVAAVPAVASVSPELPAPPRQLNAATCAAVEEEDLEWIGVAVAKELPLKQAVCKKSEPLREIAITDPAATVAEYKKFLRMMVDEKGAWFTPSKLVDELWHRHMLDTVAYCKFCERVNGSYLHHTPHYGEPHSYHDPGFMATLKAYKEKFAETPPKTIWGTVGESGGGGGGCGGGGGGCGGSSDSGMHSGYGGRGGSPGDSLFCLICCPCICLFIVAQFVWLTIYGTMHDGCVESMPADASACGSLRSTPLQQREGGDWELPSESLVNFEEGSLGSGQSCSSDWACPGGEFCNFDFGRSGSCEACSRCSVCHDCGLPSAGAESCLATCATGSEWYGRVYLGTCADLTMDATLDTTSIPSGGHAGVPWRSNNPRTGTHKTCGDYGAQQLCKLCDRQIHLCDYGNCPLQDAPPGGKGWDASWGSPGDSQYANGGMTAVDACCVCGGGDTPLASISDCTNMEDACSKLDECASRKAAIAFGIVFVLIVACVGFCVFKAMQSRTERREAAAAQQVDAAVPATAVPAGDSAMVVNPILRPTYATTAVAVATPTAQAAPAVGATATMQVAVPQGVAPGQPMLINTHAGQMQVTVPAGVMPGMMFQVNVPAVPTALVTATAVPAAAMAPEATPVAMAVASSATTANE